MKRFKHRKFLSSSRVAPAYPRKSVFPIALFCVFIFISTFLCGCAGDGDDEVIELTFWHAWGGYEGKALEQLIDEYNAAHPNVRIKPSYFTIGDKLLAAIAGGVPPDIATVWDYMLVTMGESGCFHPLEDRMIEAGFDKDAYLPGIWEYGVCGDHHWGVPTTLNCLAIYYNKSAAREAGLNPDEPPSTVDELQQWADRLTVFDEDQKLERIGYVPANTILWFWNFGGKVYDPGTGKMTIDHPRNIKALRWMADIYQNVGVDKWRRFQAGFGGYQSPQNPFFIDKMALREDGQWFLRFIQKFAPELDYGVVPFPDAVDGGPGYTYVSGSFWTIPVGTEHPDEAWKFLRWLISPEQSARFSAEVYNIPPLEETLDRPEFQEILSDDLQFFIDQFLEGRARPYPPLPITQIMVEKIGQGSERVFSGRVDAKTALQKIDRDLQRDLERSLRFMRTE